MRFASLTTIADRVLLPVLLLVGTVPARAQTLTVLHNFTVTDGSYPSGPLLFDQAGSLYGTTIGGGAHGYGTVFKLDPSGNESVLASFGGPARSIPSGRLGGGHGRESLWNNLQFLLLPICNRLRQRF
jgi:uncharacterized repeat protein (TIGR03803 family)